MDRKEIVVFLLALATASSGIVPTPKVLEGPSSKTTIVGPDGSKISAFAPGGKILLDENAGPVLQGAPEVVAIAGVAQPIPVVEDQAEEVAPVAEIKSDGDSVAVEAISTPVTVSVESAEAADLIKSATTDKSTQIEATTIAVPVSTVQVSEESKTESLEILENATDSPTVEKLTENPFSVVPLTKVTEPEVAEAAEHQPLVGYINGAPFYVPHLKEQDGVYVPENLFEQEILG
ncbi:uncharacterized protein LOC108904815 [Anoplophora glabripennis]|uniref:uncharacterized protein LOC108904815 n=1 Tax=Anoplophora glabripennis TaxID=217634 RepID=UPI000873A80A|nr:uncharacterized protein LOC108904815 [Anoplophora glabripennis]